MPDTLGLRVKAVARVLPPDAVITGAAAAWIHGVEVRRRTDEPITVTYPRSSKVSSRDGVAVRHALLPQTDLTLVAGIPVTTPIRTAFDLARQPNLLEGVVSLDALLHAQLVTRNDLADYIGEHPRWRGVRLAAKALGFAEPKSESPMESRLRMVIVMAGLPPPEPQIALVDCSGLEVARIDLGHRQVRKGYEYDGRGHSATFGADSQRRNRIWYDFGWDLRSYTGVDVYRRPQTIVAHVARGLDIAPPALPPLMLDWLASPRR